MSKYRTTPEPTSSMPPGVPYIVGNEAAERFSFYGMRAILFVFMTEYLLGADGSRSVMSDEQAKTVYHTFVMGVYFFPLLGALISDVFLGKYRTIILLSMVYCAGHLALAVDETRLGLYLGLFLIALGAGGIKPCVSAHVGDQFGVRNENLLEKVFGWFYFAINFGAFVSMLLTPVLLDRFSPSVAFAVPGVLMGLATILFWMGRNRFVHVPAGGWGAVQEAFSGTGIRALLNLSLIYVFVAIFWSLFDQTGSAWVEQAKRLDREWMGVQWLPSQIGAVNSILVLAFIPLFAYVVYPLIDRVFPLTPLRKISIGLFLTIPAFAIPAWVEGQLSGGRIAPRISEAGPQYTGERLLDGSIENAGWVSAAKPELPLHVVVQLREGRVWKIDRLVLDPTSDASKALEEKEDAAESDASQDATPRDHWVKDFSASYRSAPDAPWQKLGSWELEQRGEPQTFRFAPVEASEFRITIKSNWGGPRLSLGELEVLAADSGADSASGESGGEDRQRVWPNVAATGEPPNIVWQLLAYVFLTAAEIMVSITCLEFSYTQAPKKLKSFIMSIYLLSISAGNGLTAIVNYVIQNDDGTSKLEGASYYWFFTALMTLAAVAFVPVSKIYRGERYIQDEADSK